jgi:hypothetical protein
MYSTTGGGMPPKIPGTTRIAPFPVEVEMTVAESLQRSRERKKRRIELNVSVTAKGAVSCYHQCQTNPGYSDLAKVLLRKMLTTGLIDDCTEPAAIRCIAEHANNLFTASFQCKDGNGFELIRNTINSSKYDTISDILQANYSSLSDSEDKCIYWTVCSAFLVMYYEVHSDLVFNLPLSYAKSDFEKFLRRYPEFLLRTWDSSELLTFQLCMKRAVQCFGNGNNMGCLTELVTRICKGRKTALTCNTSGGGLRNYDHPTEVSTEKCRILIYQRESGILPRTRKSRGTKRKFCPGEVNAVHHQPARMGNLDMMPSNQSMYSAHGGGGGGLGPESMYHHAYGSQQGYSGYSYPPPSSQGSYPADYDLYGRGGGGGGGGGGMPYGGDSSYGQMGGMYPPPPHPPAPPQQPGGRMMPGSGVGYDGGYDMMNWNSSYSYPGMPMGSGSGMQQHLLPSSQQPPGGMPTGGGSYGARTH